MTRPATAAEAWTALISEGPTADAVQSYLAPGPEPRYDTPQARAKAEPEAGESTGPDRRPRRGCTAGAATPPWRQAPSGI